jgi:outer membrane lipoprotein carrier protein
MKRFSIALVVSVLGLAPIGASSAIAQPAPKPSTPKPSTPKPADPQRPEKPPPPKGASPTDSMSAKELADLVQQVYDKTRTFQAGFKQRYSMKAYNKVLKSAGTVVFEKPGKMSWRYDNGNRVVSDGKLIKVYQKEAHQMYEQAVDKTQYPAALSFLVGEGSLRKQFRLRKINGDRMNFKGGYVLVAKPRAVTPAFQRMLLYVDGATHQVRRVILLDAQGNKNRFTFESPIVNKAVAAKEFTFTPPPGTKIIRP